MHNKPCPEMMMKLQKKLSKLHALIVMLFYMQKKKFFMVLLMLQRKNKIAKIAVLE